MIFQLMIFLINSYRFFYKYVGFFFFWELTWVDSYIFFEYAKLLSDSWRMCMSPFYRHLRPVFCKIELHDYTFDTYPFWQPFSFFRSFVSASYYCIKTAFFFFLHKKFNAEIFSLDWSQIQSEFKGNLLVYNRCQGNVKRKSFSYT